MFSRTGQQRPNWQDGQYNSWGCMLRSAGGASLVLRCSAGEDDHCPGALILQFLPPDADRQRPRGLHAEDAGSAPTTPAKPVSGPRIVDPIASAVRLSAPSHDSSRCLYISSVPAQNSFWHSIPSRSSIVTIVALRDAAVLSTLECPAAPGVSISQRHPAVDVPKMHGQDVCA